MDPVVISLFLAYHASRMCLLYPKRGQGGVPNLKQGAWASILPFRAHLLNSVRFCMFFFFRFSYPMLSALEMSTHFLNAKMMALVWLETALTWMTLELDASRKVSHFTRNKIIYQLLSASHSAKISRHLSRNIIPNRLDYQPLFGEMSPHSSPLFGEDQRPDPGNGGNRA